MKNTSRLLILVIFSAIIMTACHKEHGDVTKVINVTLAPNQAYSYDVPAGDRDDVLQITQQAAHYLTNTLSINAGGDATLQYTPAKDYTGTDEIHVATIENRPGQNGPNGPNSGYGGGGCSGHHHDGTTYIFKITITSGNNPG
jgi:hypothetical protein